MQVPTVTNPSVGQAPLPSGETRVVAGPGAFGASIAQGVGAVANTAQDIVMEEKRKKDAAKVTELAGIATDANNKILQAAQAKKLKSAEGSAAEATTAFEKTKADALAATENATQEEIMNRALTQQVAAFSSDARQHETKQLDDYNEFSAKAGINAATETASTAPLNYELTTIAKGQAAASASQLYAPGEISDEQRQQIRAAAVSQVTSAQLQSLLDKHQNADFLVLYPQVKDELVGKDAGKYADIATTTSDIGVEQALAGVIYSANKDDVAKMYATARGMLTGEQEDNVIKRLNVMVAEAKGAANDVRQSAIDKFYEEYVDGGYKLSAVSASTRAEVEKHDAQLIIPLHNFEVAKAEHKEPVHTDLQTWADWNALSDARKRSVDGDITQYRDKWSEADWQHAFGIRQALIKEYGGFTKGGLKEVAATVADVSRVINDSFKTAYGPDAIKQKPKLYLQYEKTMRSEITNYKARNRGFLPPVEELDKLSAYLLAEGKRVDAGLFMRDITGRRFQGIADPEHEFRVNDTAAPQKSPLDVITVVPDEAAIEIEKAIRESTGKDPTSQQILDAYRADPEAWK